jgi:fatty-acid peroxygenase
MTLPRDGSADSTLALLTQGYDFISRRCRALDTDIFETRIMTQRAICMLGAEAARVFYEPGRFTRAGALPASVLRLLQDKGSVATLDGEAHAARKAMFMAMMTPDSLSRLEAAAARAWTARIPRWHAARRVVLLPEAEQVMMEAAAAWVGLALPPAEIPRRTRQMASMIDAAGAIGPRNWWATLRRGATEAWMRDRLRAMRAGGEAPAPGTPMALLAAAPIDDGVAAVEALNLLRPTVAVARYVVFAAHALAENPHWVTRLRQDEAAAEPLVQEVRRFYPFFPAVAGRVAHPFDWRGHHFAEGEWVLLDLHGTNHDPRRWDAPEVFRPERFEGRPIDAYEMVPQGGGGYEHGHRCAGEWATIALMKGAVRFLAREIRYHVPPQDLRIPRDEMPTGPRSGFVMERVREA